MTHHEMGKVCHNLLHTVFSSKKGNSSKIIRKVATKILVQVPNLYSPVFIDSFKPWSISVFSSYCNDNVWQPAQINWYGAISDQRTLANKPFWLGL